MYGGYVTEFRGLPAFDDEEDSGFRRGKKQQDEDSAATRIQAFYRGTYCRRVTHFLTRQRFDQLAQELAALLDKPRRNGDGDGVEEEAKARQQRSLLLMVKCLNNFYLPHVDGERMRQLCRLYLRLSDSLNLARPDLDTFAVAKFIGNAIDQAVAAASATSGRKVRGGDGGNGECASDGDASSVERLSEAALLTACQPVLQYLHTKSCHIRLADGVVKSAPMTMTAGENGGGGGGGGGDGNVGLRACQQRGGPLQLLLLLLMAGRPPPPPPPYLPDATVWGPRMVRALHLCRAEAAGLPPERRAALRAGLRRAAVEPARVAVAAASAAAAVEADTAGDEADLAAPATPAMVEAFEQLSSLCYLCPDLTLGSLTPAVGPTRRNFLLRFWRAIEWMRPRPADASDAPDADHQNPPLVARLLSDTCGPPPTTSELDGLRSPVSIYARLFAPEPLAPDDLAGVSARAGRLLACLLPLLPMSRPLTRRLRRLLARLLEHDRSAVFDWLQTPQPIASLRAADWLNGTSKGAAATDPPQDAEGANLRLPIAILTEAPLLVSFEERARLFRALLAEASAAGEAAAAVASAFAATATPKSVADDYPARTLVSSFDPRHGMYALSSTGRLLPRPIDPDVASDFDEGGGSGDDGGDGGGGDPKPNLVVTADDLAADYRLHGRLLGAMLSAGQVIVEKPAFSPCFLRLISAALAESGIRRHSNAGSQEAEAEEDEEEAAGSGVRGPNAWEASLDELGEVDQDMRS